jgi:hypothetical protein
MRGRVGGKVSAKPRHSRGPGGAVCHAGGLPVSNTSPESHTGRSPRLWALLRLRTASFGNPFAS